MPLYEYRCESCDHRFEVIQRFSDDPIAVCPSCSKGPVVKLLSSPAIQFKGSGWYITDYARKGKDGGDDSKAGPTKEKKEGSESAAKTSESTTTSTKDSSPGSSSTPTSSSKD
jgi:putative FmdB family regulatory protein